MQFVTDWQARSDVTVAATVWYWYTVHTVSALHVRSDVAVAATVWYWLGVHCVSAWQIRSVDAVGPCTMYCCAVQLLMLRHDAWFTPSWYQYTPSHTPHTRFVVVVACTCTYCPAPHVLITLHPVLVVPWHPVLMNDPLGHTAHGWHTLLSPNIPDGHTLTHVNDGVRYSDPLHFVHDVLVLLLHSAQLASHGTQAP